jgi:hypothetical protein
MVRWLQELLELSAMDAYQLVTQISLSPIANVCDTVYSVVCKVPKALLGSPVAMNGIHDQLRGA